MMKFCVQFLLGGIIAIISGILLEQYRNNKVAPWKVFSFLWAAPILLFIPLYISYSKDKNGSIDWGFVQGLALLTFPLVVSMF